MSTKFLALAVAVGAALSGTAQASPGAGSIATPDGSSIYMVSPVSGGTVVTKLRGSDRTAQVKRRLRASYEVPAVAGVEGGLSHDGRTLVLGGPPSARVSRFAVLDTRTLRVRRILSLRGTYSFDAMSPDARTLYVIRFLSQDGSHYAVQGLDMGKRKPVARTLVEKGEPGEAMTGEPITRTTSPDGSWVYTLYDGTTGEPFVHALSTTERFTVCIALEALEGRRDLATLGLELSPETNELGVTGAGGRLAVIDTGTFEVEALPAATEAPTAAPRPAATPQRSSDSREIPWLAIGTLVVAAAATVMRRQLSGGLRVRG
jgi:hypothetical protein